MSVFISSIPNTQEDDIALAKKIIKEEIDISKEKIVLENLLSKIFKDKKIFLFNRGRDALYTVFQALGISQKNEIILQAFTCIAVPTPILWIGAKPRYVDIDSKTFNIDFEKLQSNINEFTRAIIIQHTFGNLCDIKKIRQFINKINNSRKEKDKIYLIEDCAHHSFFSNKELLKYSDIVLFSFAQDKSISSTQGGLVVIKDDSLSKIFSIFYNSVPEQSKKEEKYNAEYIYRWGEIKQKYFKYIFSFYRKLTVGKIKIILYRLLGKIRKQASSDIGNKKNIRKYSNTQASLLLNQLPKIKKFDEHRQIITKLYDNTLKPELRFQNHSDCLLRYPVLVSNPTEVLNILAKEKIIGGRWYSSVVFPLLENLEKVGYIKSSCMKAELCSKYIINLPTNIEITTEIAKEIAKIVNNVGISIKL